MAFLLRNPCALVVAALALAACLVSAPTLAQTLARRLILKDGSYQSITKYEVHGDRVRYFSAERGEWEEIPKSLVDWDATEKYEQGRVLGGSIPEAAELDKELEAERQAAEARTPQVAPGLRLSDEGGVYLLDTYQNQPELAEIQQAGSDVKGNMASTILRSAINPLAGAKQNIELSDAHAKVQSHTNIPALYVNLDSNTASQTAAAPAAAVDPTEPAPLTASDRFKIIRLESKTGKRVAGSVKIAVTGKTKTDERFVPASVSTMAGGWAKITPIDPLPAGEYAVAEMLTKDSINLYVWDFGVNPSAPANPFAIKADTTPQQKPEPPKLLQKRDNQ